MHYIRFKDGENGAIRRDDRGEPIYVCVSTWRVKGRRTRLATEMGRYTLTDLKGATRFARRFKCEIPAVPAEPGTSDASLSSK